MTGEETGINDREETVVNDQGEETGMNDQGVETRMNDRGRDWDK